MVVRFILEQKKPGLFLPVHGYRHLDGARIDFLGLVELVEKAFALQIAGGNGAQIHQADGLGAVQFPTDIKIVAPCFFKERIIEGHRVDHGQEGGVPAVIGPVGVDHADFRDGRVALLGAEIGLAERDVIRVHGQGIIAHELFKTAAVELQEAVERFDAGRDVKPGLQGFRLFRGGLAGLDGVYDVLFDRSHVRLGKLAVEGVHLGGADKGTGGAGDQLNALCSRVCALIKLSGEIFGNEDMRAFEVRLLGDRVELGL